MSVMVVREHARVWIFIGYGYDPSSLFLYISVFSYMDKEEYDEAVRDYEKVYQTEKTKGMSVSLV